ncbi:hypothetical protein DVH05_024823 [Phytophthora capsici]|nr:hypothetical protein DVH05_008465 [Phytophthora capsici]KAG1708140.1 hypothetical protein DVH05_024823 [Phytophthora capsici]
MAKFVFLAAFLLAIGMTYAEGITVEEQPSFEPAEGSGLVVNATLEERCCLDVV